MHAVELPAGDGQVARNARAGREDQRVVTLPELGDVDGALAIWRAAAERD